MKILTEIGFVKVAGWALKDVSLSHANKKQPRIFGYKALNNSFPDNSLPAQYLNVDIINPKSDKAYK